MTIILEHYKLPEKGPVEMVVRFNLNVTAEEARRKVDRWLLEHVSMLIGAEEPTLVLGTPTVWRVPAAISFPSLGRVGVVGTVGVDVESGETENLDICKARIEQYLEEEIKPKLPPYKMQERTVPDKFIAKESPLMPSMILPPSADDLAHHLAEVRV